MQVPAQIDFQGFEPTERQRALIDKKITGLEDFYDRITACRFVMKAPGQHHRTGGQI